MQRRDRKGRERRKEVRDKADRKCREETGSAERGDRKCRERRQPV